MITYYLIGNWMGSFRTKSTTSSREDFEKYLKEQEFTLSEDKIYRMSDGGRIVIESGNIAGKEHLGL